MKEAHLSIVDGQSTMPLPSSGCLSHAAGAHGA